MANFTITGYSAVAQVLLNNQSGVVTKDGELVVDNAVSAIAGNDANSLLINGSVISNLAQSTGRAISHIGSALDVLIGPSGFVGTLSGYGILSIPTTRLDVTNAGSIVSDNSAIYAYNSDAGYFARVSNSGTIQSRTEAIAIDSGNLNITITNSGTILSQNGTAILTNWAGTGAFGNVVIINSGTIVGVVGSVQTGQGNDSILNTGVMNGQVLLQNGDDRYEGGTGAVLGMISGNGGNDTISGGDGVDSVNGGIGEDLIVGRGGDDSLFGAEDADRLIGGDGNDSMDGGEGNDTLTGNSGDDTMSGGLGDDLLVGQDGSDSMQGGDNNDTMDGGAGNDILEGGAGNDVLRGRDGEDELAGGEGLDFYTGGQGADVFVFRNVTHAGIGATRDQILDFQQGLDLINVVGMSPGVFEFRGTAAFAPSGNPEIRLFETPTGSTIVQFDTNGDGTQDAEIRVANVIGLTAEDFAL